jgi:polyisoprenyl-phosphate glycosyltransferase
LSEAERHEEVGDSGPFGKSRYDVGMAAADLLVLMPIFDDWASAEQLVSHLGAVLDEAGLRARLLLVDDGSAQPPPQRLTTRVTPGIDDLSIVRLRRNLGHQRAIAIGLGVAYDDYPDLPVVIMDADGEDRPEDVPRLYRTLVSTPAVDVVFAGRHRRSESVTFTFFYHLYRALHKLLTGVSVRFGNFSVLRHSALAPLMVSPDLWNHYAATIVKGRLRYTLLPSPRGRRITGRSSMNFVALFTHGLSAISVFSEEMGARVLLGAAIACSAITLVGIAGVVARGVTSFAFPVWTPYVILLVGVLLLQLALIAGGFLMHILFVRNAFTFIPVRDYRLFIAAVERCAAVS